ncbi:multidrug resistance-associated protein 10 [Perilla frutescens var. hirtella]|uniref:Multidrug resistance-associated protein 10 n=1 Tax=Perilla frutescens var. hirtella TaxID=608512 RepID=A0AAD4JC55_PERFH|nr:multidrug resistance-associated protein 10 [Perilla frutescens var. hirtella]
MNSSRRHSCRGGRHCTPPCAGLDGGSVSADGASHHGDVDIGAGVAHVLRQVEEDFNLIMNHDVKMKVMTELLNNMRVIKFQAWEKHFCKKIQPAREK